MTLEYVLYVVERKHVKKQNYWKPKEGMSTVHYNRSQAMLGQAFAECTNKGWQVRVAAYVRVAAPKELPAEKAYYSEEQGPSWEDTKDHLQDYYDREGGFI